MFITRFIEIGNKSLKYVHTGFLLDTEKDVINKLLLMKMKMVDN